MKKYLKPKCEIIELPEVMHSCGCGSSCSNDCQCHNGYQGHNPHACNCADGHGHGFHPKVDDTESDNEWKMF